MKRYLRIEVLIAILFAGMIVYLLDSLNYAPTGSLEGLPIHQSVQRLFGLTVISLVINVLLFVMIVRDRR